MKQRWDRTDDEWWAIVPTPKRYVLLSFQFISFDNNCLKTESRRRRTQKRYVRVFFFMFGAILYTFGTPFLGCILVFGTHLHTKNAPNVGVF